MNTIYTIQIISIQNYAKLILNIFQDALCKLQIYSKTIYSNKHQIIGWLSTQCLTTQQLWTVIRPCCTHETSGSNNENKTDYSTKIYRILSMYGGTCKSFENVNESFLPHYFILLQRFPISCHIWNFVTFSKLVKRIMHLKTELQNCNVCQRDNGRDRIRVILQHYSAIADKFITIRIRIIPYYVQKCSTDLKPLLDL
jgi:hypothetical protein